MRYLILAILLTVSQHARAISLSIAPATFAASYAEGGPVRYAWPASSSSLSVSAGEDAIAAGAWSFLNSGDQAILAGSQLITGGGWVSGRLDFVLHEPAAYTFESRSIAVFEDGGSLRNSVWFSDPGYVGPPYPAPVYFESAAVTGEYATLDLASSGLLEAFHHYYFEFNSILHDGNANGGFTLTMSRVPEAGSTLMLLGLAMGAIGIYRFRLA